MKTFVVIGLGRFGTAVATELCTLGHEVLAVDGREENVQAAADKVTHAVMGDARDPAVLKALGVRNYDCAIVAVGDDVGNSALITLNLKEIGVKEVIAKAQSHVHRKVLEKIGADLVIFPEQEMAIRLARSLANGDILNFIELSDEFSIVERLVPADWVGRSILELDIRARWKVTVIAVRRGERMVISPGRDYVFQEQDDCMVVLGSNADIDRLERR